MIESGARFDYVVTVCDETSAERCPIFPGATTRLHWGFPDPSSFSGTHGEKLAKTRQVRDTIKAKVEGWCKEICPPKKTAAKERKYHSCVNFRISAGKIDDCRLCKPFDE